MPKSPRSSATQSPSLVNATAERMRELILEREPEAAIGALPDVARRFGVGVVTVQQAARILEHEGLLEVRRGPGGGYFGKRPDPAALERALGAYLRVRGTDDYEALEMMTHLDCELIPAAARLAGPDVAASLLALKDRIDTSVSGQERIVFEDDFHAILFRIVDRPLIALLAQVSMQYYRSAALPSIFDGEEGLVAWRTWRRQIIEAILAGDPERARFEAERHRRRLMSRVNGERTRSSPI